MGKSNDKTLKEHLRIKAMQENVTRKLMNYIGEFIIKGGIKNISIEFPFHGISDHERIVTFNVWLSMDYITSYGKSFIEHFLDDMKDKISFHEKAILEERRKSYLSLFVVEEVIDNYIIVYDIFGQCEHKLLEPEMTDDVYEGDFFLGRVANVLEYEKIVGIFHMVPGDVAEELIYEISIDYSEKSRKMKGLDFPSYSRKFSKDIYVMYGELLDDFLEDDDLPDEIANQLNEFYDYMIKDEKLKDKTAEKHISSLANFYYLYISVSDMTLYDIDGKIVEKFLEEGIVQNFFSSKTALSGCIASIKKYANFLNNKGLLKDEDYHKILEISKNRDYYINKYEMYINPSHQDSHFGRNNQGIIRKNDKKMDSGKVIDFFEAKKRLRQ